MLEPTDERNQPNQVNTSGHDFVSHDKHIYGDEVHGDKVMGDKVIYQRLDPTDTRSQSSEEVYPSRRGCYVRMGQASASVVITISFVILLTNFQSIKQSLSQILHQNLTPIPTVEIILTTTPLLTETPLPIDTSTPQPTITITETLWNCEVDLYNCSDFTSKKESQEIYNVCLQSAGIDIHNLDSDDDGVACESVSTDSEPIPEICEADLYNCSDFASQDASQKVYDFCSQSVGGDVHKLDPDHDGTACESTSAVSESTVITAMGLSQTLSETSTLIPLTLTDSD